MTPCSRRVWSTAAINGFSRSKSPDVIRGAGRVGSTIEMHGKHAVTVKSATSRARSAIGATTLSV